MVVVSNQICFLFLIYLPFFDVRVSCVCARGLDNAIRTEPPATTNVISTAIIHKSCYMLVKSTRIIYRWRTHNQWKRTSRKKKPRENEHVPRLVAVASFLPRITKCQAHKWYFHVRVSNDFPRTRKAILRFSYFVFIPFASWAQWLRYRSCKFSASLKCI